VQKNSQKLDEVSKTPEKGAIGIKFHLGTLKMLDLCSFALITSSGARLTRQTHQNAQRTISIVRRNPLPRAIEAVVVRVDVAEAEKRPLARL
jgi:hypothetical protein